MRFLFSLPVLLIVLVIILWWTTQGEKLLQPTQEKFEGGITVPIDKAREAKDLIEARNP